MILKHFWMGFFVFFISSTSISGQSGYILNGKEIITHVDGREVSPSLTQETDSKKVTSSKRNPAEAVKVNGLLHFDEDTISRCYWLANQSSLQCVKK
jgi:hypothetical protein